MMNEKKNLIKDYITKEECNYMCDDVLYDCISCSCFNECYMKSCERSNADFVDSIEYGGYNSVADFWEQI